MGTDAIERKIREAAFMLFVKKGIRGTDIDDIAVNAGISRKVILTYFANKDHILECCVNGEIEAYRQHITVHLNAPENTVEKLAAIYQYGFNLAPVFHPIFMFSLQKYYPGILDACRRFEDELFETHIRQVIAEGVKSGQFKADLNTALVIHLQHVCFNALFQQFNKLAVEFGKEKVSGQCVWQLVSALRSGL